MIGSLKTSLIQSGLSERRAGGPSRSLGTQALGYWLEPTVCSIRTPTPSPQFSTASTPSGIQRRGGSGKTMRAIKLFRTRSPLVFTPTHRLAKEMRARGVQAQTYHSFFRWSGQTDWTPERMEQKFVPRVIICDEVCKCPAPLCKPSSTGSRDGESRASAVAIRGRSPSSPEKYHTTGSAGMPPIMKRSRQTTEPKRNAGQGASRPRPITASSNGVAKRTGRLKGWDRHSFLYDHLGRGLHSALPHSANLPRLAQGDGASRTSAVAIRAAAPNHRRNATRLAPRACRLLQRGRGRPQSQKPSRSESAFSSTGSSAERCERRFLVASGGNASWRPGSHVISDLQAEGSRQGPEAAVRAPWGVFPGHLRASVISSQGYSAAKHHGHHRWALAGWQARPARARGALEICPRGARRQVGPGLGLWQCPHRSLEPGSHSCQSPESLDHRWLSPVVQPGSSCSLTGGVSQPARAGSMPPPPLPLRVHAHSPSSSYAKSSRGSWWPISDRTKPRGSGLAWSLITS